MKPPFLILLTLMLGACAVVPPPQARTEHADRLAYAAGWYRDTISAGDFTLVSYMPAIFTSQDSVTIYIEGDGLAWTSRDTPSNDPTPLNPLALQLALNHPEGNAAYLARACQFVAAAPRDCPRRYWTDQRYAAEVIEAMNQAVDVLKMRFGASQVILVGYSGGGTVSALLAARRTDVRRLVTVAGNLDHVRWTTYHRISPLRGSLNAADQAMMLKAVAQTHFVGGADRVVPPALARQWPREILGGRAENLHVLPGFTHHCCWTGEWQRLMTSH
ncbi:MAG: alpha/beta hydrolase [Chromatiales bacterium]|nr:alpha/beta hydrolase [Chromatiales bacterium]